MKSSVIRRLHSFRRLHGITLHIYEQHTKTGYTTTNNRQTLFLLSRLPLIRHSDEPHNNLVANFVVSHPINCLNGRFCATYRTDQKHKHDEQISALKQSPLLMRSKPLPSFLSPFPTMANEQKTIHSPHYSWYKPCYNFYNLFDRHISDSDRWLPDS